MAATQASSGGIRAGRAFVELFADDSRLVRGLRAAEKKLKAFGQGIRNLGLKAIGLGAAVIAPLTASVKLFSGYGDQIAKMAKRTGLSVETLSELQFVASQTGTDIDALENGVRRMQRTIYDADRGLSTAVDALSDLGLTADAFRGLSPEEQFKLLAEQISKVEDPSRRAAIAMSIFGRSGTALLPMFASGARGIEVLQAEARKLGLTMSGEDAQSAEDFTDALDRLWKTIRMGMFNIGAALAPLLIQIADKITSVVVQISTWIKQNRQVIVTVLKVAAMIIAAGAALVVLGTIISGLGSVIGAVITVITTIGSVLSTIAAVIGFIVSPIGLVITALAALGAYLLYVTGAGADALEWLGNKFNVLKDTALAAWQGIGDALAAGDIGLAVKILWLTLKMEFQRGVNFVKALWLKFKHFFVDIGQKAFFGLLAVGEIAWHGLQVAWIETVAFFKKLWHDFTSTVAGTWRKVVGWVERRIHDVHGLVDDQFDAEGAKQLSQQQQESDLRSIERDKTNALNEVEQDRERRRKQEDQLHEQTLGVIGQEYENAQKKLDDEAARQRTESEAALAKARSEWRQALDEARQKRIEKDAAPAPGRTEGPGDIIAKARQALAGLGDVGDLIAEHADKIGVRGTFNAAPGNVQGLQSGGVSKTQDRIANAAEETAKNTRRIERAINDNAIAFA